MTTINNSLTIQYMSDLHLEFYDADTIYSILEHIKPQTNICVLAGDIGYPFDLTYEIFLCGMSTKFEHIFLIHGNHEYYQCGNNQGRTREEILHQTWNILNRNNLSNIHFLHNSYYDLGEYRIIGSVLWSEIKDPRYLSNRYDQVYDFSLNEMNRMHFINKNFINEALYESIKDNKKVVMITHHVPSYQLNHESYADRAKYFQCFSSHCDDLITDPVKVWIFGHTHMQIEKKVNGIMCVANPAGYPSENIVIDLHKTICV